MAGHYIITLLPGEIIFAKCAVPHNPGGPEVPSHFICLCACLYNMHYVSQELCSYINSFSAAFYTGAPAASVFTLSFGLDQSVLFRKPAASPERGLK